jgi:ABC-type polysaccharide/polyol phosphate export permease
MAKREVATKYVGSLLGFVCTFINPLKNVSSGVGFT